MAEPQRQQQQQAQAPTAQNVQNMIEKIEASSGQFTCSSEHAQNVLLPALRQLKQQQQG